MNLSNTLKNQVYTLLISPTQDSFRKFMRTQTGEHNSLDYKSEWLRDSKLAKEMIAIANSGGGIIIFGVRETAEHLAEPIGIDSILDKAAISNMIKNYVPTTLEYEVHDLIYDSNEYEALKNRLFQLMIINDTPEHLPFMAKRDSTDLKANSIYIRRGTSCEVADQNEITRMINRRISHIVPNADVSLSLDEHLKQLKKLYEQIPSAKLVHKAFRDDSDKFRGLKEFSRILGQWIVDTYDTEPNPEYPDESYEAYIAKLITMKKKKIERVLDLK